MEIPIHDSNSAPEGSKPMVEQVRAGFGFVPHLIGVMAGSPSLLKAYLTLQKLFEETSLTPTERQVVLLETSVANGCEYCVAAHTAIADRQGVPLAVIGAIRDRHPIADARLDALRELTREIVSSRGWPASSVTDRFLDAGFGPQQLLEVILGVGIKTLSNYTNHLASTPLDMPFSAVAWSASGGSAKAGLAES